MSDRILCTIIAKNYVAFARTLAQSFLTQHVSGKVYVLIVDDFEGYINPAEECFEIVKLAELRIPKLPEFCFKYNLKELCTATKASFLEYLLRDKSCDGLIYLDPDILITGSLDGVYESLSNHDIILTPHLDTDYPDDGLLPNDSQVLRAGQFNLGFIAINSSENARTFLRWWKSKWYEHCVIDVANGYFVDQKFIDFVPLLFARVLIEKDTGYNVGYWNLHSRSLTETNGSWGCNEGALHFFHFSGYDPDRASISTHIPEHVARFRLANRSDLRSLFARYKKLLFANGHAQAISWPYTFDYFKNGERVPRYVRTYYRRLPAAKRASAPFEELEELARADSPMTEEAELTQAAELEAIHNSRAWRWVFRYGRFKHRFLQPVYDLFRRPVRKRAKSI
ncbi:MAG TPA: hypothetical protein VHR36_05730 [Pyrinomonadaceae bacterium]|nr:hypothetical protein [Pyrinomonadaceae bacterium]